jgi:ATP-dependent protease ClpP protease subunit
MGNKYMKRRTYRFTSANEEVPPAPGSSEEEIAILQYLDEVKPQQKDRGDYLEITNNRIYFYSDVATKNVLGLNKTLRELGAEIQHSSAILECQPAGIFLHINSHGGDLFAGLAAMDEIRKSKVEITSIIDGCAASAATLMSVAADKRLMNKHAYMLIHQLSSGMWGKYHEMKDEMENYDNMMKTICDIYVEYTKIPKKKLNEILQHDLWFDAETCLKYGLVDEII